MTAVDDDAGRAATRRLDDDVRLVPACCALLEQCVQHSRAAVQQLRRRRERGFLFCERDDRLRRPSASRYGDHASRALADRDDIALPARAGREADRRQHNRRSARHRNLLERRRRFRRRRPGGQNGIRDPLSVRRNDGIEGVFLRPLDRLRGDFVHAAHEQLLVRDEDEERAVRRHRDAAASDTREALVRVQRVDEPGDDPRLRRRGFGDPGRGRGSDARRQRDGGPHQTLPRLAAREHGRRRACGGSAFGDPLKVQQQIVRALDTLIRILRETGADDAVERGRHERLRERDRRRVFFHDRAEQTRLRFADERAPAGEHLVEDAAEGPDVGARVRLLALHHLRRHVLERSEDRALRRQRRRHRRRRGHGRAGGPRRSGRSADDLREAEIEQLDSGRRQHHVARFQIAMEDSLPVRGVQGAGHLDRPLQRLIDGNRSLRDARGERLAFEKLHHEEGGAVLLPDVEQRADVGVIQLRDRARLALEPLAELRSGGDLRGQRLDGDAAIEPRVAGLVDLAHAAGAQRADDFIRTETRAV